MNNFDKLIINERKAVIYVHRCFLFLLGSVLRSDDRASGGTDPVYLGVRVQRAGVRRVRRQPAGHHQEGPLPPLRHYSVRHRLLLYNHHQSAHAAHPREMCKSAYNVMYIA